MDILKIALSQYAEWEWPGKEQNPAILKYFKETGFDYIKDDETAWCAAFVNWCLVRSGKVGTKKLNARSFLKYGEEVKKPQLGDIVVLWRDSINSGLGHVGFFIRETPSFIYILGGNQGDQVNISKYSKKYLLAFRRPI